MIKVKVDNKEIEVESGSTVLQACEASGVEIPRFCYHEKLEIAGNCRMCLVEVEGGPPKPVASCAMPASEGMVIKTDSDMVKKAREGAMEFLLINHPLDCPICDQGGECDLQDQAMVYGKDKSRYKEEKRAVSDGDYGPLIKTIMTRCIHCTRCIRFSQQVAGVENMGALYRGEDMEVTTYVKSVLKSELSGNIIDLCPVGALTSKPYEFKARPWELKAHDSIDVMDAFGSNIRIDVRGRQVMRILPDINEEINEEWISDKIRFSYDGLINKRLDRPYHKVDGKFKSISWEEAINIASDKLKNLHPNEMAFLAGDMCDVESMLLTKTLANNLKTKNIDCRNIGVMLDNKRDFSYICNTPIEEFTSADLVFVIGSHVKKNAPLLNAKIKYLAYDLDVPVYSLGVESELFNYEVNNLGNDFSILKNIYEGNHELSNLLKNSKRPLFLIGEELYTLEDYQNIVNHIYKIADKYDIVNESWNGYNLLVKNASTVGGLDIGFISKEINTLDILNKANKGVIRVLYLNQFDNIDNKKFENCFVIYQGHHGDKTAKIADLILPSACFTEKTATYVNLEGRCQSTKIAVQLPNLAKNDLDILNAIIENLGFAKKSNDEIKSELINTKSNFANYNEIVHRAVDFTIDQELQNIDSKNQDLNLDYCYYTTNSITRASATMNKCTEEL